MGQRLQNFRKIVTGLALAVSLIVPTTSQASVEQANFVTQTGEESSSIQPMMTVGDLYQAEWVDQSANPTLLHGQAHQFSVTVKNIGGVSWDKNIVQLGTDRGRDRIPRFVREGGDPSGWVADNRVAMSEEDGELKGDTNGNGFIDKDEAATFEFWYTVNSTVADGLYREYFNLVAEDITWFPGPTIFWDITVDNKPHARFVEQNAYPSTLKAQQSYEFIVSFENTGQIPWSSDGPMPVRLGADRPMDRVTGFVREGPADTISGWITENRVEMERDEDGNLVGDIDEDDEIDQGEIARFRFWLTVPSTMESGQYKEYFRPVMDGIGWMEDFGLFWEINVDNIAPRPASVTVTSQPNHLNVKWLAVIEATSYRIRYRAQGERDYKFFDVPAIMTEADIEVVGGQDFEVGVASLDAEGISPYVSQFTHVESIAERQAVLEQQRIVEFRRQDREISPPAPQPTTPAEEPELISPPSPTEEVRDWRQFWLTLLILLGAAGLATAGYYAYEWWVESKRPRSRTTKKTEPEDRKPRW